AAFCEGVFVSGHVFIPKFPLVGIRLGDLPSSLRFIDALFEALFLLVLADVQEEFQYLHVVFAQRLFKLVDLVVTPRPDILGNEVVDAYDENIFVMRAVENPDIAVLGNGLVYAPEKIVRGFLGRWRFEWRDGASLRVHAGHYVPNRAVFSGGIDSLKNDQQGVFVLGVEQVLQLVELYERLLQ